MSAAPIVLAVIALAQAPGPDRGRDRDPSRVRAGLQASIDAARPAGPLGKAAVRVPAGAWTLDRPLWLDRDGVGLVGEPGARLKCAGCFPAVISGMRRPKEGWLREHAVATSGLGLGGDGYAWDFKGDSYLNLRASPFDLGPWAGENLWKSRLTFWEEARTIRFEAIVRRDGASWERQALWGGGAEAPEPLRVYVPKTDEAWLEILESGGTRLRAAWALPAEPVVRLDVTLDLEAGRVEVVQNGRQAEVRHNEGWRSGLRLRAPESEEFCVAKGYKGIFDHGRFALAAFRASADGAVVAELAPLPAAGGHDGLWKWTTPGGQPWGFGLLRRSNWGHDETTQDPFLRDLELALPDWQPYGQGVLLGLVNQLEIDHCTLLFGARGLDQALKDTCYENRIHHSRFSGHRDAHISLDYGISSIDECIFNQGGGSRCALRLRRHAGRLSECFIQHEPRECAVKLPLMGQFAIERITLDYEAEPFPPYLVWASRGYALGRSSVLAIRDTPGARVEKGGVLVVLEDDFRGKINRYTGRSVLVLDASFINYLDDDRLTAVVRRRGPWEVVTPGGEPRGVPLVVGADGGDGPD